MLKHAILIVTLCGMNSFCLAQDKEISKTETYVKLDEEQQAALQHCATLECAYQQLQIGKTSLAVIQELIKAGQLNISCSLLEQAVQDALRWLDVSRHTQSDEMIILVADQLELLQEQLREKMETTSDQVTFDHEVDDAFIPSKEPVKKVKHLQVRGFLVVDRNLRVRGSTVTNNLRVTAPPVADPTHYVITVDGVGNITKTTSNIALGSTNAANTFVARDAAGNFSAGTITAGLTGNVTGSASLNVLKAGDVMIGTLTINPQTGSALNITGTGASSLIITPDIGQYAIDIPTASVAVKSGIRSLPTFNVPINGSFAHSLIQVNSLGEIGLLPSSKVFKDNIQAIDPNYASKIYELTPVKFNYKKQGGKSHLGFIAEDVDAYLPELVVHNNDGEVYTIDYISLIPLLLHEIKQHKQALDEQKIINQNLSQIIAQRV